MTGEFSDNVCIKTELKEEDKPFMTWFVIEINSCSKNI